MKKIFLIIVLSFVSLANCGAQHPWIGQNDHYIDDLPFTQDGDLIFSEVVPVAGAKAMDLFLLFNFRSYPSGWGWKPPYVIKSPEYRFYITDKEDKDIFIEATVLEKLEMEDNKLRYSLKVVEFPYMIGKKEAKYSSTPHSVAFYFDKSNYFEPGGRPKKLNEYIKLALIGKFSKSIEVLKKLDFETILAASNDWKDEEKENNWQGQVADLPKQAPFDTYLSPELTVGLKTGLVYKGVIHNSLDQATQIKRLLRYMDAESGYEDWLGSEAEGMVYNIKDELEVKAYLPRSSSWDIKLIPEKGGCRYEFIVKTITESSPKNIYNSIHRTPDVYAREIKQSRVEDVLTECNNFAETLLKKFSVVFTSEDEEKESWNAGIKVNNWKSQNSAYPASMPFDRNGILRYAGVVTADGPQERQYEQLKKFIKENYEPSSKSLSVDIMNDKAEKETIQLTARSATSKNVNELDNVNLILRLNSLNAVKFHGAKEVIKLNNVWILYTAIFTFGKGKCKYEFIVDEIGKEKFTAALEVKVVRNSPAIFFKDMNESKAESQSKFITENFDLLLESLKATMGVPLKSEKKKDDW